MEILPEKVCPKCKATKPATLEHFPKGKPRVDGTPRLDAWCRDCRRQGNQEWRGKNREAHNIKQNQKYRAKHPAPPVQMKTCTGCQAEFPRGRKHFASGKPHCRECGQKQYAERQERSHLRAEAAKTLATRTCSKCQTEHPNTPEFYYPSVPTICRPCHLKHGATYSRARPLMVRAKRNARRAMKKAVGGKHTAQNVRRQLNHQKGLCYWCRSKLETTGDGKYHVDHLIALSKGGTNGPENIVCACPTCNLTKSDRTPWDFAGRLL